MDLFTSLPTFIQILIIVGIGFGALFLIFVFWVWSMDKMNDEKLPQDVRNFFMYIVLGIFFLFLAISCMTDSTY